MAEITASLSMLEICQAAAVLIGASPPTDIEGGSSSEEVIARSMYENIVQAELANRDWKFCDVELELARDATAPETDYDARYVIPTDAKVMHVQNVLINDAPCIYRIMEGYVHCDATENETVVLVYQKRVDELYWPPAFRMLIVYRMAMLYGASVAGKPEIGSFYNSMAERQSSVGSTRSSQQQSSQGLRLNRLTGRRR